MNRRRLVLIALILGVARGETYSQSYPSNAQYSDQGLFPQNSPNPCTDPTRDTDANCASYQHSAQGLNQPDENNSPSSRSTMARPSEDSSLNGAKADSRQLPQFQALPPEAPTEFQKFVAATTGQVLPIYGASLFKNVPTTFSPNDTAPATADYVVGPDDELRLRIWGQYTYSGNLRVDRSGDVYIEGVGAVHVAGLPFASVDQHLRAAVSRLYRNFDLAVDMGKIRSIQIYVTGQARRPGAYTVSSLSSLVDALFASGGPSGQGSLRHIQLKRDGKQITDFDLYALLIHGDKSRDIRLLPEDVLFIPPVGPQVAIAGSIHNPGIYELVEKETLADLIDLAGRATTVSSNARISIDRIFEHQNRQAMEVAFDSKGTSVEVNDGDIVRIFSILPAYRNTITLSGSVANPGRFGWHEGMHVSDLIPDRDSLVSRDYWWKRSHLGLPGPEFEPFISEIGRDPRMPESSGAGYTTAVSQETLTNAMALNKQQQGSRDAQNEAATGSALASSSYGSNANGVDANGARENGANAKGWSAGQEPALIATAPPRNDIRLAASDIDWSYAVVERLNPDTLKTSLLAFDLGKLVLEHDSTQDLALEPGDTVTIFSQNDIRVPLEQQTKYVRLEGEFVHAGVYSTLPGETLRDLVQRAGGLTGNAYLYGSEFSRESTRMLQQQRIDEYVNRVDLEVERGTLAISASATSSAGSLASVAGARSAEQDLITRLRQMRATGRIVLQLGPKSEGITNLPVLSLENGDRFAVPPKPAVVNVVGAVNNQSSFEFMPYGTTGQYLIMAGGSDRDADKGRAFIIRANGSVLGRTSTKGLWGDRFNEVRLNPGDTIVVPDKTLRPTALRGLLDWTQIFSQLAIGAAAVNILR